MAYDRYDWHCGGDYPKELPDENGGTHIGMFLAWIIHRKLEGEFHHEESAEALQQVRERQMTGRDFLFDMCDGKFWEEDLSDEGNAFAKFYYDGKGQYVLDYDAALSKGLPSTYHVENTWENFDKICPVIDQRFKAWKDAPKQPETTQKAWWRFWEK